MNDMTADNDFFVDSSTGLASFPTLEKEFKVRNFMTFNNEIWGNMNQKLATTDTEKKAIDEKDRKLADYFGAKTVAVATTPTDGTLIHYDTDMHETVSAYRLPDSKGYKFLDLSANAVVLEVPNIPVVFAPRDCPILAFVHKDWEGVALVLLGAPQTVQLLHDKVLTYLKGMEKFELSDMEVFITPHICPEHYLIDAQRRDTVVERIPEIDAYLRQDSDDSSRYHFDFMGYAIASMKQKWGIDKFHGSGLCTYESAKQGDLHSFTLSKEDSKKYPHKGFNVAFMLRENG